MRAQYFTMEGVKRWWIWNCLKGAEPGNLEDEGPQQL